MSTALDRGLKPGVDAGLTALATYDQFYFQNSAVDLALVTFAVKKMKLLIDRRELASKSSYSFLAKVQGQSFIGQ